MNGRTKGTKETRETRENIFSLNSNESWNLHLHTHKHPSLARDIEVMSPVVQSDHIETDPLKALRQRLHLILWDASIDTRNNV